MLSGMAAHGRLRRAPPAARSAQASWPSCLPRAAASARPHGWRATWPARAPASGGPREQRPAGGRISQLAPPCHGRRARPRRPRARAHAGDPGPRGMPATPMAPSGLVRVRSRCSPSTSLGTSATARARGCTQDVCSCRRAHLPMLRQGWRGPRDRCLTASRSPRTAPPPSRRPSGSRSTSGATRHPPGADRRAAAVARCRAVATCPTLALALQEARAQARIGRTRAQPARDGPATPSGAASGSRTGCSCRRSRACSRPASSRAASGRSAPRPADRARRGGGGARRRPRSARGTPAEPRPARVDVRLYLHPSTRGPGPLVLRRAPLAYLTGGDLPPAGRFNAGQKVNARLVLLVLVVVFVPGLGELGGHAGHCCSPSASSAARTHSRRRRWPARSSPCSLPRDPASRRRAAAFRGITRAASSASGPSTTTASEEGASTPREPRGGRRDEAASL